jgi:hypothetical protein
MHITTNLYIFLKKYFILKSKFIIYMHKKIASHPTIHLIQKQLHVI